MSNFSRAEEAILAMRGGRDPRIERNGHKRRTVMPNEADIVQRCPNLNDEDIDAALILMIMANQGSNANDMAEASTCQAGTSKSISTNAQQATPPPTLRRRANHNAAGRRQPMVNGSSRGRPNLPNASRNTLATPAPPANTPSQAANGASNTTNNPRLRGEVEHINRRVFRHSTASTSNANGVRHTGEPSRTREQDFQDVAWQAARGACGLNTTEPDQGEITEEDEEQLEGRGVAARSRENLGRRLRRRPLLIRRLVDEDGGELDHS